MTETCLSPTQFLRTCSFPACPRPAFIRNPPSARLLLSSANKSNHNVKFAPHAGFGKKKKRKEEDDPWESFFQQLEKDLENDKDDSIEEEITEEDVANLEKELDTLLEDIENASTDNSKLSESSDIMGAHVKDDDDSVFADEKEGINAKQNSSHEGLGKVKKDAIHDEEEAVLELADDVDEDGSDDEFEEPRIVNLQKWQVRKLAAGVELGRRKVNIKSLAAELKLDRDDVIFFLKNPPPELLMAVAIKDENAEEDNESIPDEVQVSSDLEKMDGPVTVSVDDDSDMKQATETQKPTYGPRDWYKGKRIKKTNLMTLQRVYKRSRWPTKTMIESVVQVTHLPRSRVLEWFEEERAKTGVQTPPSTRHKAASRKLKPVAGSFERLQ